MRSYNVDKNEIMQDSRSKGRFVVSRSDALPLLCAMVTFKYAYNYYSFVMPALSGIISMIYTAITFFMLILYIPLALKVIVNLRLRKYRILLPAIVIPTCVLVNIVYVAISSGDFSVFSRSYQMAAAAGTNDAVGYYFAQINTWFGNMAVLMYLSIYIRNKQDIIKCIIASMAVLVIPTLLIMIIHPSYLGERQSSFGDTTKFSGGLWNIGVVGFGSISWLGLALVDYATKKQKRIIYFSVILFMFVGVAGISRTIILMIAFSFIVYFLLTKKDMHWWGKILLIVFGIVLFYISETDIVSSILFRLGDSTSGSNNIRIKLWGAYLSHYKEFWLIGAPIGSIYNYYRDVNLYGAYFLPHSVWINFWGRFGIAALISYSLLLKRAFIPRSIKELVSSKSGICLLSGGVAYVTLAFINQTGYAEPVFYIMFGLAFALAQMD